MKKIGLICFLFLSQMAVKAQQIGEVKIKSGGYNEKQFDKLPKKVYVHSFVVNYQILFEREDRKAATSTFGGGYKGSQLAKVATVLEGVDNKMLTRITDKLFEEFKAELNAKGIEVISAKDIQKPEVFDNYDYVKGGRLSSEGIPGCISVTPSQIDFYEKERLLANLALDKGPKISDAIDEAVVAQITLNVPYLAMGGSGMGLGESQVKVKTSLRVAQSLTGSMKKESKLLSIGSNDVVVVQTAIIFGGGKRGMAYKSNYTGYLNKDVMISGVMDNETIKAVSRTTNFGTHAYQAGNLVFVYYENDADVQLRTIEVDGDKYENGVLKGLSTVLMTHTKAYLQNY